jgi:hypothetical protein
MQEEITDKTDEKQNDKPWLFKPGQSGNPEGRPKGSVSIKDRIRKILEADPKRFEELCEYYLTENEMRKLLWTMLEGNPQTNTDLTSGGEKIELIIKEVDGREDKKGGE